MAMARHVSAVYECPYEERGTVRAVIWLRAFFDISRPGVGHPWFAPSDRNGDFRMAALRPDRQLVEAVHRKVGKATRSAEVGRGGSLRLDFVISVPGEKCADRFRSLRKVIHQKRPHSGQLFFVVEGRSAVCCAVHHFELNPGIHDLIGTG